MFTRTITPEDLARLKAEREIADRAYNEALSALDAATLQVAGLPAAPPGPDETQITPLNERWNILSARPPASGWRGRLFGLIWRFLAPVLERQQAFNAALTDHVNRNLPADRTARAALETVLARLERELERLAAFESRLIVYLQHVTPYVDTKDRELAGLGRRIHEDNAAQIDVLDHRTVGLGGAISGVSDDVLKRWESMVARERRFDAKVTSLSASHDKLRATLASVQQATQTLKREVERTLVEHASQTGAAAPAPPARTSEAEATGQAAASSPLLASALDAYKYVGFEDQFRGSRDDIRSRMAEYLPYFEGASDVLDVGCGRGEFLDLLREQGLRARGLDVNHEMVEICRAQGLDVQEGDAVGYLASIPDASLGGLLAAQVVEHLEPDYLLRFIDLAYHKLRPGARLILETINPTCWFAFFQSYLRDITHVQPIHPDTLSYFVTASGFQRVTVRYRAPYPEHEKLQKLVGSDEWSETFNANVERLNRLLFTFMDYAVIGERM